MNSFWSSRRVLVTGHTGFKGSWLTMWLSELGANVHGYSLDPAPPSFFDQLGLGKCMGHFIGDIRDENKLQERIESARPDVLFHLAAQPLVRRSYRNPRLTWQTNTMGTINVMQALRNADNPCVCIVVTTDKVYENLGRLHSYREHDRLGGHDPYSSSKAATELAVSSWRNSYWQEDSPVKIATVRAGNVIGGGDWSEDRIVPDMINALAEGRPVPVRNPSSIRPWQHVLEPLSGYMLLAQKLWESNEQSLQDAFNFGPEGDDFRSVKDLVEASLKYWPGSWKNISGKDSLHEAQEIGLSTEKAKTQLGWTPRWTFHQIVERTVQWYKNYYNKACPRELTLQQIEGYSKA